jgi:hypothetical protein
MERKFASTLIAVISALILLGGMFLGYGLTGLFVHEQQISITPIQTNTAPFGFTVHCTVTFWKNGQIVFQQYHAGSLTYEGYNITMGKLLGNSSLYNMTIYNENTTQVSIGYNTTNMAQSLTVLPNEWNRTAGTVHDIVVNANPSSWNLTAIIHPGTGPYTAGCIGINYESGIGNNALFGYDTFAQKTGIDNAYTITVEFKVSVA